MARLLAILARVALAVADFLRREKDRRRVDAVRSDPVGQWLRRFGGKDKRTTSPHDAGGRNDG